MNFLTPDLLLDLIAAENVGVIGVLIWIVSQLLKLEKAKPARESLEATLETVDDFAVSAYGVTQNILESVKTGYNLAKGYAGDVRAESADGVSMAEADSFASRGQEVGRSIKNEISEIVNGGGDAA
ncbi:MAG: hypothetical protein AAFO06_23450 [Cyanobacteria bacterium J06597_16]